MNSIIYFLTIISNYSQAHSKTGIENLNDIAIFIPILYNRRGFYERKEITHLLEEFHQAQKNLKKAKKSLKLNLFGQDKQKIVRQHKEILSQLQQGYLYLFGILTTFNEGSKSSLIAIVSQQQWDIQLHMLGSYITEIAKKDASYKLSLDLSLISSRNNIPQKLEPYHYQVSLYNDTLKLMNTLRKKGK